MNLNLNIDYIVDDDDRKNPQFRTNATLSITLMRFAINAVKGGQREGYKDRTAIRVSGKVVNALTKASNAKATEVVFDQNELLHVRDTLKEWVSTTGVPGNLTGWYEDLMVAVEKLVEEGERLVAAKRGGGADKAPETKS